MAKRKKRKKENDQDSGAIPAFLERTDRLSETKLAGGGRGIWLRVHGWSPGSFNADISGMDMPELSEFLLVFRPFVLAGEKIYVDRIYNMAYQKFGSSETQKELADWRRIWDQIQNEGLRVGIKVNGKQLRPREVFEYWMNKEFFHAGVPRRGKILEHVGNEAQTVSKTMLWEYLSRSGIALRALSDIIRKGIKAEWSLGKSVG